MGQPAGCVGAGRHTAPTCAVCHMSGIGDLATTHNVQERLKWDLMHKKSVVRSGDRGDGLKGQQNMLRVCANCHGPSHVKSQRDMLDNSVGLYNMYWDGAVKMKKELKEKGLLGKDPWQDGFLELEYYLWHHVGRRARQGAMHSHSGRRMSTGDRPPPGPQQREAPKATRPPRRCFSWMRLRGRRSPAFAHPRGVHTHWRPQPWPWRRASRPTKAA